MGFKLSRLAQAVMAIAFYSTSSFAAEKTDDFYIEIKGPESNVQQSPLTKPIVIKNSTEVRIPQPYIPENRDKSIISTKNSTYGPVRSTDTTWSIANSIRKLYPNQNFSTQKVMQALYRKNPHAFVNGKLTNLLAGSRLAIPSADEIKVNSKKKEQQTPINTVKTKKKEIVPAEKSRIDPVLQITPADNPTTVAPIAATPVTTAASSSVVASTEPSLVDSKVSELVGATNAHEVAPSAATAVTPHVADNDALLVYETENKELKNRIQQLNEQVGHLQAGIQNQEELKQELADLQAKLKELEQAKPASQEKAPDTVADTENKEQKGGFWHDILATPLNLLLLISLPVLAVLVVLSFWLRSRAKREMAAREQEMSESTTLLMDETNNDFSDLLAVDLSDENVSFPDLNLEDESLIPTSLSQDVDMKESEIDAQEMSFTANTSDVEPAIIEDLPPLANEVVDLNTDEDEQDTSLKTSSTPDFSALLSDADLASALEDDFVFSATEPLPSEPEQSFDLSMESEEDDAELVTRLNLDKVLADPGVKMSDQLVSEPEGWELPEDDNEPVELISTAQSGVNLQEVNNDSNKPWLQQFENEQLDTDQATVVPDDYLSIDELLAQADKQDPAATSDPDSMQANLDIGLDEFPDMLPEHDGVDIDDDGGVGAKLDLARAYLEIDDKASAKELLLEVQTAGSNDQVKEAEKLLSRIS
jgi:pilus assembly protein FimV